jgi:predicted HAD superfamily Cof-like phosphohydrolase
MLCVEKSQNQSDVSSMTILVLEGPDAAGKSTLGRYLSDRLNLPLQHSGGTSKHSGEINERALNYIADTTPRLYDRHPCVSNNIYNSSLTRLDSDWVPRETIEAFYATKPIIVYCRPTQAIMEHAVSEYTSSQEHNAQVEANYSMLLKNYDMWALRHATFTYRIGDDQQTLLNALRGALNIERPASLKELAALIKPAFDPMRDIEEFHEKYGMRYRGAPRLLPPDLADFRNLFMDEELDEYKEAMLRARLELEQPQLDCDFDDRNFRYWLEKAFDALLDLTYVTLGTADFHGFNFREGWKRVHAANMQKIRASRDARSKRGNSKYDIIKPRGWRAPSHADLVASHAHRRNWAVDSTPVAGE